MAPSSIGSVNPSDTQRYYKTKSPLLDLVSFVDTHTSFPHVLKKLMTPFVAILAHPQLAIHVRHVDIRSIPELRPNPHPKFLRECTDALNLCKNLSSFKYIGQHLPPFLMCIQNKSRLQSLSVNANLTEIQAAKLAQIMDLRSLSLDYASWQLIDILPKWTKSLQNTLKELTVRASIDLNECVLRTVLSQLPNLRALHVVECPKVDHVIILQLLKHVPLLESLAFSVSDTPLSPTPPPKLSHLRHLAIGTRLLPMPTPAPPFILSALLFQIQHCFPPLSSFVLKSSDCGVEIPKGLIEDLVRAHGATLTRVALVSCEISNESLSLLCQECIHLERLEVCIPVKDIIIPSTFDSFFPPIPGRTPSKPPNHFVDALAKSSSLRTLIDRSDVHATHGPRRTLSFDAVHFMMSAVNNLRSIVNDNKVWTGTGAVDDMNITIERPKPSYVANDWFLPRN